MSRDRDVRSRAEALLSDCTTPSDTLDLVEAQLECLDTLRRKMNAYVDYVERLEEEGEMVPTDDVSDNISDWVCLLEDQL